MQATGIGPALRKARLLRGKSIEEASRETRIRAEYIQALERERFESLIGDVYARGFLRSYSTYLGLDADKVLTIYNRHFGGPRPMLPEPEPGPVRSARTPHPHLATAMRDHPSWTFLIGVALLAVGVFAAMGVLRSESQSPPAQPAQLEAATPVLDQIVTVDVTAVEAVTVVVTIDGTTEEYRLQEGEARSFQGQSRIALQLDRGSVATITVNGYSIGEPGEPDSPYSASFGPLDYRGSPSAGMP